MNIKLSEPDLTFYHRIEAIAKDLGCYALVKWHEPMEVRFILLELPQFADKRTPFDPPKRDNYASEEQHDAVIARLFMLDPHAIVRTARVTYDGAAEFYAVKQGLEPA